MRSPAVEPGIAVVVPTLNEAHIIGSTLKALRRGGFCEIIVSDGGSHDETLAIAGQFEGVRVVRGDRGRGLQLSAGVMAACAPLVVVVHADTLLPADAADLIRDTLADGTIACGCFTLQFDNEGWLLSVYAAFSRFETRWTTFGDQGFFFRRSEFMRICGAPAWPLFEDVELRRRFLGVGRFRKLKASVTTSARRFEAGGHLRVQVLNAALLVGYHLGLPLGVLATIYENRRARRSADRETPASRNVD